MGTDRLYQVLPIMRELKKERREEVEQFFQDAPDWLLDSFRVVELDKNVVFIRENQPVDTVHIIVRGMFKITDYRVYGIAYDFMQFDGINAMGGMELIMDLDTYQATLQTITPCTSIRIPADVYARWLRTDIRALKQEAKIMGHYLYEQGVTSRTYMFVPGRDRVAVLFEHRYKKYAKNGKLTFTNTRQELAEYSGLSVKTVNRAVKKFEEQGLISRSGKTFYIDEGQYEQLHALVSKLIEPLIERGRNDEPDL